MTGPGGLEEWHPRDIDTLRQFYEDRASAARMDVARAAAREMMGR